MATDYPIAMNAELDGCDFEVSESETLSDSDIDAFVLFAGVDPEEVDALAEQWKAVFG